VTARPRTTERRKRRLLPGVPRELRDAPSRAIAIQLPGALAKFARTTTRWRPGCEITVLRDGAETYPAMLAAIDAATVSVCMETYILAADYTGDRFKTALLARAHAGVAVRLIYDAVGLFGLSDAWLDDLREAGVEVIDFNPIRMWRRKYRLSYRDHRKILVVDDAVAFTGGLNIANDYAAINDGGAGWHDMHCRVRGPIVRDLARMFRRTWLRAGGTPYTLPAAPPPTLAVDAAPRGRSIARLIDNTGLRQRTAMRRAYLHVIKHAQRRVLIQNAYFLPDRGVRRALARAARRGVDVRVIVPGKNDVQLVAWASLYVMRVLARRGVKVFQWPGPMMHAKTAVVDGTWSTIGSYNFDAQSRFNNLEVTVEILDDEVSAELVRQFDADVPACTPYDEAVWLRQPWWRKAMAWLAFRLRRFL
jgi:cardiolipin synthase A/B